MLININSNTEQSIYQMQIWSIYIDQPHHKTFNIFSVDSNKVILDGANHKIDLDHRSSYLAL